MKEFNHSGAGAATASDLQPNHPLLRWLPRSVVPYAIIARWDRPIGVWLMLLPGLWGLCLAAPALPTLQLWLLFLLGGWAMRGAGCTINDLLDRKLDAQVLRTAMRPLANGAVSLWQGVIWLLLQLCAGLIVLVQLPPLAQLFGIAAVPLILMYPLMKRVTWWPQAWLGLTFNWGLWIGTAVYGPPLAPAYYLMYLGALCWTLGYDTIYAVQDQDDDSKIGVRSTARLWGHHAPRFVFVMYAAALLCWLMAGSWLPHIYLLGWIAAASISVWLLYGWQPGKMLSARRAFIRNQYVGLALLIGIILSKLPA